ncbi:hypothetical protein BGZ79_003153, partial [Entomortierella chlamydospora]
EEGRLGALDALAQLLEQQAQERRDAREKLQLKREHVHVHQVKLEVEARLRRRQEWKRQNANQVRGKHRFQREQEIQQYSLKERGTPTAPSKYSTGVAWIRR